MIWNVEYQMKMGEEDPTYSYVLHMNALEGTVPIFFFNNTRYMVIQGHNSTPKQFNVKMLYIFVCFSGHVFFGPAMIFNIRYRNFLSF